jgi:LPS-assembly protein
VYVFLNTLGIIPCEQTSQEYKKQSLHKKDEALLPRVLKENLEENPLHISAMHLTFDQKKKRVTAKGSVYIQQDVISMGQKARRVLHADTLIYDIEKDTIIAKGNVWLHEPTKDVIFTDSLVLKDKMKRGISNNLKALMSDDSRLSACAVERIDHKHIFKHALYSPCKLYKNQKAPTWQLKATEVVHDREKQVMVYRHARLEFLGVPVFYTPYFVHPDPAVKRQSGFLFPTYGSTTDLGRYVAIPYYYTIDPTQDLTVTPLITSRQGAVLSAEYRKSFDKGQWTSSASATRTRKLPQKPKTDTLLEKGSLETRAVKTPSKDRWHFFMSGDYHISDSKRLSWDIKRASDTTYLRRYPIIEKGTKTTMDKTLNTSIVYEQFKEKNYFSTKAFVFQTDTPRTTPILLPLMRFVHQTPPKIGEGFFCFDARAASLVRDDHIRDEVSKGFHRFGLTSQFFLPFTSSSGHIFSADMKLHKNFYIVQSYARAKREKKSSTETLRVHPEGIFSWRFPLVKTFNEHHGTFEPIVSFHLSPKTHHNHHLPNEDSRIVELDDTNLFSSRFSGIDRLEEGQRVVGGAQYRHVWLPYQSVEIFLGQSRRLDHRAVLGKHDGEDHRASDYVTRFYLQMGEYVEFHNRSALFRKTLSPRYMETQAMVGPKKLKVGCTHTYISAMATEQNQTLSQLESTFEWNVHDSWFVRGSQTRNLKSKAGGALSNRAAIIFKNDCFTADFTVYKSSFKDRDIAPDKGFLFKLTFKNLGSLNVA